MTQPDRAPVPELPFVIAGSLPPYLLRPSPDVLSEQQTVERLRQAGFECVYGEVVKASGPLQALAKLFANHGIRVKIDQHQQTRRVFLAGSSDQNGRAYPSDSTRTSLGLWVAADSETFRQVLPSPVDYGPLPANEWVLIRDTFNAFKLESIENATSTATDIDPYLVD